jgi:hypothetical protein
MLLIRPTLWTRFMCPSSDMARRSEQDYSGGELDIVLIMLNFSSFLG